MGKLRTLIVASVFMVVGCASGAESGHASTPEAAQIILRPYLGRWVPTSFAEERNIVSLTISATALSIETGGVLKFTDVREVEHGVVVQAIDQERPPAEASFALGLRLQREADGNDEPRRQSARELLWIYWCDSIRDLSGNVENWRCSKNAYLRRTSN